MQRIAIVGAGPTGIYTLAALIEHKTPMAISVYEAGAQAGVGMPFEEDKNHQLMLANIASIEIPPLTCSYLDWLLEQPATFLQRYAVDKASMHERQFLPRVLLGHYFRDQFLALVTIGQSRGHQIAIYEGCEVTDITAGGGIGLWTKKQPDKICYDRLVIATGHVWPSPIDNKPKYFPSPWSGLIGTHIPASTVGIMGTSLSGIDAAMAVAVQHGQFHEQPGHVDNTLRFECNSASTNLKISLMSRSGLLPEADFYCPIPHEPLTIVTTETIARQIEAGPENLLDRVFTLIAQELALCDPEWSTAIDLPGLNADTFAEAYFSDRAKRNPFNWARHNLEEVVRNKQSKHTVPWRYALLRLHSTVQEIVPHLNERDQERFNQGLKRIFIDNYAAVPPESIRRLLALRNAGVIEVRALGEDYHMNIGSKETVITTTDNTLHFEIFIDARGQKPLDLTDLPFPRLRKQLLASGDELPQLKDDYTLVSPAVAKHRITLAALPFLMRDKPFVQGITVCAEIGKTIGSSINPSKAEVLGEILTEAGLPSQ